MRVARRRNAEPVQALFAFRRAPSTVADQDHRFPGLDEPTQAIDGTGVRHPAIVQHTPLVDQKDIVAIGHRRDAGAKFNTHWIPVIFQPLRRFDTPARELFWRGDTCMTLSHDSFALPNTGETATTQGG